MRIGAGSDFGLFAHSLEEPRRKGKRRLMAGPDAQNAAVQGLLAARSRKAGDAVA
jgi:hypothetical protein